MRSFSFISIFSNKLSFQFPSQNIQNYREIIYLAGNWNFYNSRKVIAKHEQKKLC